jgi:geranylgeranyl pyrophosphate synthase
LELDRIYEPIREDLEKVEQGLQKISHVDFAFLSQLIGHSLKGSAKRIRPALTLLSGKFYDYNLNLLLPMAMAVEIMHTATLVHDDAIDKSMVRRGKPTINKLWGEDKAVLLGDYLFAEAGAFTASTKNLRVINLFAETLRTISNGELNQAYNAFNLKQNREQYYQRIAKKTSSLFCMVTESGSALSQAPEESIHILIEYGYNFGIAFQVVDDVLDFIGSEEELGKPIGSDLAQGTVTLPIMLLLENYPEDESLRTLFESRSESTDKKHIIEMVRNSPAIIKECYQVAADFCGRACTNLKRLPENPARQSLIELADFTIRRKK